ncbi:MAG: YceI family protein [Dokdonella sp.]
MPKPAISGGRSSATVEWSIRHPLAIATALVALTGFTAMPQKMRAAPADGGRIDVIQLDQVRSQVDFRVRLIWLLRVGGRFGKVSGSVHVDHFRNQVSVDAHIDVNAISMDSHSSEEWAKSSEFFDAEQYPQIDFSSEPIPQARLREGGELAGILTLRGVRQPVGFQLLPAECDRPAYDCPIEVEGSIRRSIFGMHSRHGTLGDRVELRLSVYATAAPAR